MNKWQGAFLTASALVVPVAAFSQDSQVGTLIYGTPTHSVPMLGGFATLALALAVFVVSFRAIRRRASGITAGAAAVSLAGILFAAAGGQLLSDAYAPNGTYLSNPAGGTVPVVSTFNHYINDSGVTQTILNIDVDAQGCPEYPSGADDECVVGLQLAQNGYCEIICASVSDVRLKRDIALLAETGAGIRLYSFKYLWSDETYVGVMAQDLLQDEHYRSAVAVMSNGYYAVNYASLGLRMMTLDEYLGSH